MVQQGFFESISKTGITCSEASNQNTTRYSNITSYQSADMGRCHDYRIVESDHSIHELQTQNFDCGLFLFPLFQLDALYPCESTHVLPHLFLHPNHRLGWAQHDEIFSSFFYTSKKCESGLSFSDFLIDILRQKNVSKVNGYFSPSDSRKKYDVTLLATGAIH